MRIVLDEAHDRATIYLSDERQTYESGFTEAISVTDEGGTAQSPIFVQLGFEAGGPRLLWVSVEPASRALPAALLAQAARS